MAKSYIVGPGGSISHNGKLLGPGQPVGEEIIKALGKSLPEAVASGTLVEKEVAPPSAPPRSDLEKRAVELQIGTAEEVSKLSDADLVAKISAKAPA